MKLYHRDPETGAVSYTHLPELIEQIAPQRYLAIVRTAGTLGGAGHESGPGGFRHVGPGQPEEFGRAGARAGAVAEPYQALDMRRSHFKEVYKRQAWSRRQAPA